MISIAVCIIVALVSALLIGSCCKDFVGGFLLGIPIFLLAFMIAILVGVSSDANIVETKVYETKSFGDGIVYIEETGTPQVISDKIKVKTKDDVDYPVMVVEKYDYTIWLKGSNKYLLMPRKVFKNDNSS